MNKKPFVFLFVFLLFCIKLAHSDALPTFSIIPKTATTLQVADNSIITVAYMVRNNSKITRTLTLSPILGVSQVVGGANCNSPFILAPGQSCQLTLNIIGSQVPPQGIHGGPVVCKTRNPGDPSPDIFLCSRPTQIASLNIDKVTGFLATISINPSSLVLIGGSGIEGIIFVTNNSTTITAMNIHATLPATWSDVFQDSSDCLSLAPGATRRLRFIPGNTAHPAEQIPIAGSNTNQVFATISVTASPLAYISNAGTSIVVCKLNPINGSLSNCTNAIAGGFFFFPNDLALNAANTQIYVVDTTAASISLCSINATGMITGCIPSGAGTIPGAFAIGLRHGIAYITNNTNVITCNINPNSGILTGCASVAPVASAGFFDFNPSGSVMYIAQNGLNSVIKCNVSGATVNACVDSGLGAIYNAPIGIAVNNTGTLAYVVEGGATSVLKCTINPITGFITSCVDSGAGSIPQSYNIRLNASNTEAYITTLIGGATGNQVFKCNIDSTGNFVGCVNSGATGLAGPTSIVLTS